MGEEINLMINYPKSKRDIESRVNHKTLKDQKVARKFSKDFFDGDRRFGYGGFNYHPKFWHPVIPTFQEYYNLNNYSKILDVGCAKGFMLHDFKKLIPGIHIKGIDISEYAINNCIKDVENDVSVADARSMPFDDNTFDLVISINTVHNLNLKDCKKALNEITRVSKRSCFITVDAFTNDEEKEAMFSWNLTAKTILHVNDWKKLFIEVGYHGDYYWFKP